MRTRIGVEKDGPLEFLHGGGHLVREREVVDGALAVRRRDHERQIRSMLPRWPRWSLSESRPGFVRVTQCTDGCTTEFPYHVDKRRIHEEGSCSILYSTESTPFIAPSSAPLQTPVN